MNYHGQSITLNTDVRVLDNNFPSRSDLLNNDEKMQVANKIRNKESLLFMSNDLFESFKKEIYKLFLIGILPDGSKTVICINGIYPYVILDYDKEKDDNENRTYIRNELKKYGIKPYKVEFVMGKDFKYYSEFEQKFIKVSFTTMFQRNKIINDFIKKNIKTYNNDLTSYYRVISREYLINLCNWNIISDYTVIKKHNYRCQYYIEVDIDNINATDDKAKLNFTSKQLELDKCISGCFDIEAYTPNKKGEMPSGKNPDDICFMIGLTFQFIKSKDYLLNIVIVSKPCDAQDDIYTIICPDEKMVIRVFGYIMTLVQPDFLTEFNGSGFDWPFIIDKSKYYGITTELIKNFVIKPLLDFQEKNCLSFHYPTNRKIKLEAKSFAYMINLKVPGIIMFDTQVICKNLFPLAEKKSLNHFLMMNQLGSKDDMGHKELFRIYENNNSTDMARVAHYCFIDCYKLHELALKKTIIQDKREVCTLSATSMYDGFYYAGGLKVRNLIMLNGFKKNLFFDLSKSQANDLDECPCVCKCRDKCKCKTEECKCKEKCKCPCECKYPGATVLQPIKGLVSALLTIKEYNDKYKICDDISLVEELIINNFKKFYLDKEELHSDHLSKDEQILLDRYYNYISTNENQYPVSGLDFSSLYPSLIMAYNICPTRLIENEETMLELKNKGKSIHNINFKYNERDIVSWTVRHDNDINELGLYPSVLIELFNSRKKIKQVMYKYTSLIEDYEKNKKNYDSDPIYIEATFQAGYYNSKQAAVKVFMNTLYGEMGNKLSSLFMLPLAGGVTSMGQYNLLMVRDYVKTLNAKVYYGDTDSVYMSCNKDDFIKYDELYYTNKIDKETYYTDLINQTFTSIGKMRDLVNQKLFDNNQTPYLKMAYEEVLYPCAFLSKKKYYGIPHENVVNFKPKKLFIRGLEVKKRGVSDVLKIICNRILWDSLDVYNTSTIKELVINEISNYFTTKWNVNDFIKTAVYKPDVKNVMVITFMNKMIELKIPNLPEPGDRFKYIVVKRDLYTYDIQGRQYEVKMGDRIEFPETVIKHNLDIDLLYYFENEITGQFARLISYDPEYNTYEITEQDKLLSDKELYKKIEENIFKNCKNFIINLSLQYGNPYRKKGKLYKSLYKQIKDKMNIHNIYNKNINQALEITKVLTDMNDLHILFVNLKKFTYNKYNFNNLADKIVKRFSKNLISVYSLYKDNKEDEKQLTTVYGQLGELINKYPYLINTKLNNISQMIDFVKNKYELDNKEVDNIEEVIPSDQLDNIVKDDKFYQKIDNKIIKEFYNYIINIISIHKTIKKNMTIKDSIYFKINKQNQLTVKPKSFKHIDII